MKLRAKQLHISSGGHLIAVIHKKDAARMDIHAEDRIKICKGSRIETAMVNVTENSKLLKPGQLGLFDEVHHSLKAKDGSKVTIALARKPRSLDFIRAKVEGHTFTKKEIEQIVWDISHNKLSDIELTYFVAACYTKSMTMKETVMLTKAMAQAGDILKFPGYPIIDKHCIGGIPGNRTTMIVVPMLAAAGYSVPKTSSRSITSPAGTADTMEVLAPVTLPLQKMQHVVKKAGACIVWGGALNLAPADDKIIHVEKPLEIDAESQLLASIMAKKYSVSSSHIVIDIPIGPSSKVRTKKEAAHLKGQFLKVGKALGKKVHVLVTDGSQPIGNGIGPSLEARDVLWVLKRDPHRPLDLERKCVMMVAEIFSLLGVKNGKKKAKELLDSRLAYKKMVSMIKAQGGKERPALSLPVGQFTHDVVANKGGRVVSIDNISVSRIARIAGAPVNHGAGMYLYKHVKDSVKKGERLFTMYSQSEDKLRFAKEFNEKYPAYTIG